MHLGGLLSTQEARVALASYAFFVLTNLPRASITRWLHAARLPFLNCEKYRLKKTNYSRVQKTRTISGKSNKNRVIGSSEQKNWKKGKKQMDGKGMKVPCTLRSRAARGILIAEHPRAKRAQRSTMGNKIWETIYPRKFGYDVTVRPSVHTTVRTFRVVASRNEFLPSPLESFVPYCFKSL